MAIKLSKLGRELKARFDTGAALSDDELIALGTELREAGVVFSGSGDRWPRIVAATNRRTQTFGAITR
jgi:hypothetical protein